MVKGILGFIRRLIKKPVFTIRIAGQKVQVVRGEPGKRFANECMAICKLNNIEQGYVYGVKSKHGIRLEFSKDIPESCHQKFRNVYGVNN